VTDLPLAGIRVIDLSRVLAGPFATMLLGDLGADVVKVEPPDGDESRAWGPPWWGEPTDRRSAYFASVNRNKRSIVLDLRTEADRASLDGLLETADLLVHNYRRSTAARLGLQPDALRARHPRLIAASIGGFPGADADRPAYDILAQAVSGLMSVTGEATGPPMKAGVALLDLLAGLECAVGALAALVGRGCATSVQVSLVEAAVSGLTNVLANRLATGVDQVRHGNEHPNIVPYQPFSAADGDLVLAAGNDGQFARLCGVLGVPLDPALATNPQRVARRADVMGLLQAAISARPRDELLAALEEADVPAGPVNGVGEAVEMMERAQQPGGWVTEVDGIRLAPSPIRLDGATTPIRRPPPLLGEHSAEIQRELAG
jgi:crotonobetainyl-CoA:carnitine CoA-transferase CaiB-like acyl-CoA transferase